MLCTLSFDDLPDLGHVATVSHLHGLSGLSHDSVFLESHEPGPYPCLASSPGELIRRVSVDLPHESGYRVDSGADHVEEILILR